LTVRCAPLVGNVLRMKTPLKYGTRIRLASSFNCTLVVAPDGIFIVFSAFFFLCSYTLSMFVRTEIQSAPVLVRSEIQSATLFHRVIVTLQLFKLTSHGFAVIYRFRHTSRSRLHRSRIQGRPTLAETVTHRLISLLEVSAFSSPFSSSSSSSISCPCRS